MGTTAKSPKSAVPGPPVVGEPYIYTVTYSGVVTARNDDGSLVIGAYTVPRRTGDGVSMVMIGEPADPDACGECEAATNASTEAEEQAEASRTALLDLNDLVADHHDENHDGAYAFCPDGLCRRARDLADQ